MEALTRRGVVVNYWFAMSLLSNHKGTEHNRTFIFAIIYFASTWDFYFKTIGTPLRQIISLLDISTSIRFSLADLFCETSLN
jgi:hypothetical protein